MGYHPAPRNSHSYTINNRDDNHPFRKRADICRGGGGWDGLTSSFFMDVMGKNLKASRKECKRQNISTCSEFNLELQKCNTT